MRLIGRLLLLALVLACAAWALLFALANEQLLAVDLVLVQLPALRSSVVLIGAFIIGGLCGLLAGSGAIWRAVRSQRVLRRSLVGQDQ